ncbi:hypothetical protein [Candidatus Solirubrobacter pratensis]|uniref:hypothetical protein n=1 Tax=Candidatus Solirubrobacter pratensis TaxID=1298857 RepID=UPI0003FBEA9A|nr:hypothetical protein [Candidatus Solirubrobacter pratensis]
MREKLAFLPAKSDAVGRTSAITGSAQSTESRGTLTIAKATIAIDVSTLKSDRALRDDRIRVTAPSVAGAVSVEDRVKLGFDLRLKRG